MTIVIPKVHAIAMAILPIFAVCAFSGAHPLAVAHIVKTLLPNLDEIVGIDASLVIVGPDAGARGD